MILSLIEYKKGNSSKQVIVLILGRKGDKLSAILDESVGRKEAEIIKRNVEKLSGYSLQNKIAWIKQHAPNAYKSGYREFYMKNIIKAHRSYSFISNSYINSAKSNI